MKLLHLLIISSLLLGSSCKKILVKPDPESDAEKNFEIFWNDIHNGYPYFEEDHIDWNARYNEYRPKVNSNTTTPELFDQMKGMLKGFSDGHLSMKYGSSYYSNDKTVPNLMQLVRQNQSGTPVSSTYPVQYYLDHYREIARNYLSEFSYQVVTAPNEQDPSVQETICIYGMMKDQNILYINIATFLTQYDIDNLLREIFMQHSTVKGLILDLRMNEGGNLGIMWRAMSVFLPAGVTNLKYGYNREKVGPHPLNFGPEKYFGVAANANPVKYSGPLVVLCNRGTVSAAEHATMAIREMKPYNKKIKIIGDYTFGATSFIVQRTLPNGIQYTLVNSKTWDIQHQIVERTGVKPDEFYYQTEAGILQNTDEQLVRAVTVINNNLF